MCIYMIGCLIAIGFFVGIYWSDGRLGKASRNLGSGGENETFMAALLISVLVMLCSWLSVIAMIANTAYEVEKKNWNV